MLATADQEAVRRIFGDKALLAGSKPLGIDLAGSDTDILVPYKTDYFFTRAVRDMLKNPDFRPSSLNAHRPGKQVFTYKDPQRDIDIVLARGGKGFSFRDAFLNVQKNLTDEQRALIIAEKERLKKAWFLKNMRYKKYKDRVAEELGLKQHYF